LIVGEKLNYCSMFDCSKQKEFKERSSGNAQNKYELKMKFPRAADDTCTSSVRPQNKRYRIKAQL
jgi:hypothetical protein